MTRVRRELGATSVEYLAVLAFVVSIAVGLLALHPAISDAAASAVRTLACRVLGEDCGTLDPAADDFLPDDPCVVATSERRLELSGTAVFVHLGGEAGLLRETKADGTVEVTLVLGGKGGAEAAFGAKGHVDIGDLNLKAGAEASLAGGLTGEGGRSWRFPDGESADGFISNVEAWVRDELLIGSVPLAGPIYKITIGKGDDFEFPEPNKTFFQGGAFAEGEAEAGVGGIDAGAEAEAAAVLGMEYDHDSGERTYFLLYESSASLGVDVLTAGVAGRGDGEFVAAVTYDEAGTLVKLSVTAVAGVSGKVDVELLEAESGDLAGLSRAVEELELLASGESTHTLEFNATLDLKKHPEERAAAEAFLSDPLGGAVGVVEAMDRHGIVTFQTFSGERGGFGVGASVALAAKAALEVGYENASSEATGAWVRIPGYGLVAWAGCGG